MIKRIDNEGMVGLIILIAFLLLGPLALLFGEDSRTWDERGWWPGGAGASHRHHAGSHFHGGQPRRITTAIYRARIRLSASTVSRTLSARRLHSPAHLESSVVASET